MSKKTVVSRQFAVGDRVKWRSQASGHWKEKVGVVVHVVPAFQMNDEGKNRDHESYVVEVSHAPRKPSKRPRPVRKPERYWPLVRNLRLVKRGSTSAPTADAGGHGIGDVPEYAIRRGEPVTVDRDSFTDVKLVERGPNTEALEKELEDNDAASDVGSPPADMLARDVADAQSAIESCN